MRQAIKNEWETDARLVEEEEVRFAEEGARERQTHAPTTRERPRRHVLRQPFHPSQRRRSPESTRKRVRPHLVLLGEAEPGEQLCRARRARVGVDVDQEALHLSQPRHGVVLLALGLAHLGMQRRAVLLAARPCPPLGQVLPLLLEDANLLVELLLLGHEPRAVHVGLEDAVERGRVVADDLLLDVQDRDVLRDGHLAEGHGAQQGRLSDTVAADEACAAAVGEREGRAREDAVRAKVELRPGGVQETGSAHATCSQRERNKTHVDVLELDVLALALALADGIERVDLEEELLVRLFVVLSLHELAPLVQRLGVALLELALELGLGLFERLEVDLRLARLDLRGARACGEEACQLGGRADCL